MAGNGQPGSGQRGDSRGQGSGNAGWNTGTLGEMRGMYRSGDSIPEQGAINNQGLERAVRDSMRELSQMRSELREATGPELQQELDDALNELRKYDPAKISEDPLLANRIRNTVLPAIEQLELQLRRKLEGSGAEARAASADRIPPGYADAIAEYFRKLSRGK
jgi:hypothetical protein